MSIIQTIVGQILKTLFVNHIIHTITNNLFQVRCDKPIEVVGKNLIIVSIVGIFFVVALGLLMSSQFSPNSNQSEIAPKILCVSKNLCASGVIKTDPVNAIINPTTNGPVSLGIYGTVLPIESTNQVYITIKGPDNKNTTHYPYPSSEGYFQTTYTLDDSSLNGTYHVSATYRGINFNNTSFNVLSLQKPPPHSYNFTCPVACIRSLTTTDLSFIQNDYPFVRGQLGYIEFMISSHVNQTLIISVQVEADSGTQHTTLNNWFSTAVYPPGSRVTAAINVPNDPQYKNATIWVSAYYDWPIKNDERVLDTAKKTVPIVSFSP